MPEQRASTFIDRSEYASFLEDCVTVDGNVYPKVLVQQMPRASNAPLHACPEHARRLSCPQLTGCPHVHFRAVKVRSCADGIAYRDTSAAWFAPTVGLLHYVVSLAENEDHSGVGKDCNQWKCGEKDSCPRGYNCTFLHRIRELPALKALQRKEANAAPPPNLLDMASFPTLGDAAAALPATAPPRRAEKSVVPSQRPRYPLPPPSHLDAASFPALGDVATPQPAVATTPPRRVVNASAASPGSPQPQPQPVVSTQRPQAQEHAQLRAAAMPTPGTSPDASAANARTPSPQAVVTPRGRGAHAPLSPEASLRPTPDTTAAARLELFDNVALVTDAAGLADPTAWSAVASADRPTPRQISAAVEAIRCVFDRDGTLRPRDRAVVATALFSAADLVAKCQEQRAAAASLPMRRCAVARTTFCAEVAEHVSKSLLQSTIVTLCLTVARTAAVSTGLSALQKVLAGFSRSDVVVRSCGALACLELLEGATTDTASLAFAAADALFNDAAFDADAERYVAALEPQVAVARLAVVQKALDASPDERVAGRFRELLLHVEYAARRDRDDASSSSTSVAWCKALLATRRLPAAVNFLRAAMAASAAPVATNPTTRVVIPAAHGLDEPQKTFVHAVLARPRLVVMHGAPGTGKSHTLVACVDSAIRNRLGRALVVAASASATIELAERLARCGVKVYTATPMNGSAAQVTSLRDADAVVTTAAAAAKLRQAVAPDAFQFVVIDDAGQLLDEELLAPITVADERATVVLAGDPTRTHPAVVSNAARAHGLGTPLLARMPAAAATVSLRQCYRCHGDMTRLVGGVSCDGQLRSSPFSADLAEAVQCAFLKPRSRVVFIDVRDDEDDAEAAAAAAAVCALLRDNGGAAFAGDIGVIVAFEEQVAVVRSAIVEQLQRAGYTNARKAMQAMLVGTPADFEGLQRAAMVVCLGDGHGCDHEESAANAGIVGNEHATIVSLSRAESMLAIVGCRDALHSCLDQSAPWRKLLSSVFEKNALVISHADVLGARLAADSSPSGRSLSAAAASSSWASADDEAEW